MRLSAGIYVDSWGTPIKRRGSKHNISRQNYLLMPCKYAKRGEQLKHSKLTEDDVRKIRIDADKGITAKSQASEYGVHIRTIEKIRRYESWTHV